MPYYKIHNKEAPKHYEELVCVGNEYLRNEYKKNKTNFTTSNYNRKGYNKSKGSYGIGNVVTEGNKNFKKNSRTLKSPKTVFPFDPNTLDSLGFIRLGISKFAVKNILKWRSKGGTFKTAESIKKIYGISEEDYNYLHPFIEIKNKINKSNKGKAKTNSYHKDKMYRAANNINFEKRKKAIFKQSIFDINDATVYTFQELYGIGDVLSTRIIKFRDRLGGFYAVNQIKEVYGISDSLFTQLEPYFKISDERNKINKIDINKISQDSLKLHPYINWKKAQLLYRYRQHHGPYKNINSLYKLAAIDSNFVNKIAPYLIF